MNNQLKIGLVIIKIDESGYQNIQNLEIFSKNKLFTILLNTDENNNNDLTFQFN